MRVLGVVVQVDDYIAKVTEIARQRTELPDEVRASLEAGLLVDDPDIRPLAEAIDFTPCAYLSDEQIESELNTYTCYLSDAGRSHYLPRLIQYALTRDPPYGLLCSLIHYFRPKNSKRLEILKRYIAKRIEPLEPETRILVRKLFEVVVAEPMLYEFDGDAAEYNLKKVWHLVQDDGSIDFVDEDPDEKAGW